MTTKPQTFSNLPSTSDLKARIHALRATGQNHALREAEQIQRCIYHLRLYHSLQQSHALSVETGQSDVTNQLATLLHKQTEQLRASAQLINPPEQQ